MPHRPGTFALGGSITRVERLSTSGGASDVVQVTGTSTSTGDCTVTSTLTNDGGTWEGGCTGTTTWTVTEPEHMHDMDCTLVGAGGYEGLRYVFSIAGAEGLWALTGQIESLTGSPAAS